MYEKIIKWKLSRLAITCVADEVNGTCWVRVRKGVAARGLARDDPFPCSSTIVGEEQGDKHTTGGRDIGKYLSYTTADCY